MCPICEQELEAVGVLCADCQQELDVPVALSPEQIVSSEPGGAAGLIDMWGRLHRLGPHSHIGRRTDVAGLHVLDPSVSRRHAELEHGELGWGIRDTGSANGTFVDEQRAEPYRELRHGVRIRFGNVSFFFVSDAARHARSTPSRALSETRRLASESDTSRPTVPIKKGSRLSMSFRFQEPTGGGGAVMKIEGTEVQLTVPQFELLSRLVTRMLDEVDVDDDTRGFVGASELVDLSLEVQQPEIDHVRQLVRRIRRILVKAGLGDLVESRYGYGYRLRVLPRLGGVGTRR